MEKKKYKVFIQSNKKQLAGALIAKHSIISNSKRPELFEVEIMELENYPQLLKYEGKKYLKNGHYDTWNYNDLQSFTMTRFLPPQLMNYEGRAIAIDPDVFATEGTEIMELFEKDMNGYSILACSSGGKGFKSSVMLLDCAKLKHWNWERCLEEIFTLKRDYRDWAFLNFEPKGSVGVLEDCWNHCDILNEDTRFIHYTRRLTQPWKTGLKVDFRYDIKSSKFSFIPLPVLKFLKRALRRGTEYHTKYMKNPYPDQETFFFKLVKNALSDGAISNDFVKSNIALGYIRKDFEKCLV